MRISEFIRSVPVIRLLIPVVAGIIIGELIPFHYSLIRFSTGLILMLLLIIIWLNSKILSPIHAYIKGLILNFLFIVSGIFLVLIQTKETDLPEEQPDTWWITRIEDFPVERAKSCRTTLVALGAFNDSLRILKPFQMFLYLGKDAMETLPVPGTYILVKMKPVRPMQNGNPREFNYRTYLFRKGIYYQAFAAEGSWEALTHKDFRFRYLPLTIQHSFTRRLKHIIANPESFGIMSALAVGNRNYIDDEIKTAYSDAGAMHVLAVSGLHVGLVWYVLNLFFGRLKYFRNTRIFYWFFMTALLWMYVMIAGMSASVTRAGIMLTLVVTSSLIQRSTISSNPVFLSAFILIVVDPAILFDVGFQFSYLAVFGIIFFQPRIKAIFRVKGKLLNYFAELATVSMAAQLGTFIPAIYYFHKFPSYFIITNFIVIPLVTIVLFSIIISAFFWSFEPLFNIFSHCGAFFANWMNSGVRFIEGLPASSIKMIYIDILEVMLLVMCMVFVSVFILKRTRTLLVLFSIALSCIFIYGGVRDWEKKSREFMVIHNIQDILAVNLYSGGKHYMISSDLDTLRKAQLIRSCQNFWLHSRVGLPIFIDLTWEEFPEGVDILKIRNTENHIVLFNGIKLFIISDFFAIEDYTSEKLINCDFYILNTRGRVSMPSFINLSEGGEIIASSSFRGRFDAAEFIDSPNFFDVRKLGAYQTSF